MCVRRSQADVMALNPDMHDVDVRRLVDSIKQVDNQVSLPTELLRGTAAARAGVDRHA